MVHSLPIIRFIIITTFLLLTTAIYLITTSDMQKRKDSILTQQISNLKNAYKVSQNRFEIISDSVNNTILQRKDILELLYKAKHSKDEDSLLSIRNKLYEEIKPHFKRLQKQGVIITLFSFPDNKTFLRVHKPNKFNDDLSKIRYSFKYVNANQVPIRGFEQGKISHAFRNIYPIFYKNEFLGSVDIAFSSKSLQDDMNILYDVNTHFILNKNLFKSNIWKMKGLSKYTQSIEHEDFLYSLNQAHKEYKFFQIEASLNNKLRKEIYEHIKQNKAFALSDEEKIISFFPIKNIKKRKTVAYLISYVRSQYLKDVIEERMWINIFSFITLLFLGLIIYNNAKERILLNKGLTKELVAQNKAFETIFEKASDGVLIYENNKIIQCNESVVKMFGFNNKKEVMNKSSSDLSPKFQPDGVSSIKKANDTLHIAIINGNNNFEWRCKRVNGEEFWTSVTLTAITLKSGSIIHALLRDISTQKNLEQALIDQKTVLNYKAFHDVLTMIPNRALFDDRLTQLIKSADRNKESFAVIFIDLDKFKPINDSLGHWVGDEVLKKVAKRLKSQVRDEDTIARIGGDEFSILMQKLTSVNDVAILGQKIIDVLKNPIIVDEHVLIIGASIGISLYPLHSTNSKELVSHADTAMYKVKNEGRNHFQIYSPDMII